MKFKHLLLFLLLTSTTLFGQTTVVDIVVNSEEHDTLEAAVVAAGLVETLSGDGPFTVFAPTDDAFATLPDGTLDALLADPQGALTSILTYHVVGDSLGSNDLVNGQVVTTLNGDSVNVMINDNGVFIENAQVTMANISADNGIVHIIDVVLNPDRTTVFEVAKNSDDHNTLEAAIRAANLNGTLSQDGPFTVFAPTDGAFNALPEGTVETLLMDPEGALSDILLYHVVQGNVLSTDLVDGMVVNTISGDSVQVTIDEKGVTIGNAMVSMANIEVDNGVVHVVDAVILPPVDVKLDTISDFGSVLVDNNGRSLYFFADDADGNSSCIDGCLNNWPIYFGPSLSVGEGLDLNDFGAIDRGEGVLQTTYKGWPLYYFTGDMAAGDVNGEGLGNKWFVAKPDYTIMLANNQLIGLDGNPYTSDYTQGEGITNYLTDDRGNTLYVWVNDNFNQNNFTNEDFSNNGIWPIYEQSTLVLPSIIDESLFTSIDVFGRTQLTYKGRPLYFFGQDSLRGQTLGVSVPAPGIWPVAAESITPRYETVVDIVVNSEVHETLESAVVAAGLVETLSSEGPFTIFAPTDDAFNALPEGTLEALLDDPQGALTTILTYHVVNGNTFSTDLSNGQVITTLNGDSINVMINENGVFIENAQVTMADIEADNGVVHVIDLVLNPDRTTVYEIAQNSDVHNTLEAAIRAAGLNGTLSQDGPFTLFAPTDDAFAALPEGTIDALLADPQGALTSILTYHVVGANALSTDLSNAQVITTLNGDSINVTINENGVFIENAQVTMADIEADNGVVHVVDVILNPDRTTVFEIAQNSDVHTTLEAAIRTAGLNGTLSQDGPFTLFAPTDDAFAALPEGTIEALLADAQGALTNILTYHVVGANALSSDLVNGQVITTLNGDSINVTINENGVFIENAQLTMANIETDNGVVHIIDVVLNPDRTTVFEVAQNSDVHNTLETAIRLAALNGVLSLDGPYTVFAPTDDAFGQVDPSALSALLADPAGALSSVLTYHVVAGTVLSSDLESGTEYTTLNGETFTVTIEGDAVMINNASVIQADIETDNGFVHVIDGVLLPSTVNTQEVIIESIQISPTITEDVINITIDQANESRYFIFDINGRSIDTGVLLSGSNLIEVQNFGAGTYFISIFGADRNYIGKFIKK